MRLAAGGPSPLRLREMATRDSSREGLTPHLRARVVSFVFSPLSPSPRSRVISLLLERIDHERVVLVVVVVVAISSR